MLPPRPLLAVCLLLIGGLAWSVDGRLPPHVALAEVARWEGQSVTLEGWAQDIRRDPTATKFTLVEGDAAVSVRAPADASVSPADRVAATGRLARVAGSLTLILDAVDGLAQSDATTSVTASWDEVVAEPGAWQGHLVQLRGRVDHGRLVHEGHSVALGNGPWPRSGDVVASVLLRFEAECLCYALDAREVRPWTS